MGVNESARERVEGGEYLSRGTAILASLAFSHPGARAPGKALHSFSQWFARYYETHTFIEAEGDGLLSQSGSTGYFEIGKIFGPQFSTDLVLAVRPSPTRLPVWHQIGAKLGVEYEF